MSKMSESDAQNGHVKGVEIVNGKKTFIPLENNPEVFTALLHSLGIPSVLTLHDIYSFDPADLAYNPRPAHALLFIVPGPLYHQHRKVDKAAIATPEYTSSGADEPVVWFRQTIGHACGLIAMLHALANDTARAQVPADSDLEKIFDKALGLSPGPRAQLLYDSRFLEEAHMAAAVMGDTVPPSSKEPNGFHYICYTRGKDGHLWELEGAWNGPIDRGVLKDGQDVLSEEAIRMGPGVFLETARQENGDGWFSCVALCGK